MKIGIVSDLHCNHQGLLRAFEIIGDVDELICLGDSIYEYRFSNEVVRMLKGRGAHVILGNHEEGFLGPHGARARQADWIDRTLLDWLAERPHRVEFSISREKVARGAFDAVGASRQLTFTRIALCWTRFAEPGRISCSTATPTISWCAASAMCW